MIKTLLTWLKKLPEQHFYHITVEALLNTETQNTENKIDNHKIKELCVSVF